MFVRTFAVVTVASTLVGCDRPPSPEAHPAPVAASSDAKAAARAPESRHMYRFDYTLTTTEPDKPPSNSAYSLTVEENNVGEIRLGKNVPLQTTPMGSAPPGAASAVGSARAFSVPRQDIGLLLRCSFSLSGEDVVLKSDLELSTSDPPGTIRKVSLKGDALVSPGKPSVVSSSEDPTTHQRYQLSVTTTKLR